MMMNLLMQTGEMSEAAAKLIGAGYGQLGAGIAIGLAILGAGLGLGRIGGQVAEGIARPYDGGQRARGPTSWAVTVTASKPELLDARRAGVEQVVSRKS